MVAWSLERVPLAEIPALVILEDAPFEVVALIENIKAICPAGESGGIRRSYPFGAAAGHALGYMDEVKEDEVEIPGFVQPRAKVRLRCCSGQPYARGIALVAGLEQRYEGYFAAGWLALREGERFWPGD